MMMLQKRHAKKQSAEEQQRLSWRDERSVAERLRERTGLQRLSHEKKPAEVQHHHR
jgi:hypothetical protein